MNEGLFSAVSAMQTAERQLDAVATNLANLGTVGYKRLGSSTNSFARVLEGAVQEQVTTRTAIDFSQGELRHTGLDTDLALEGAGFFAVETPEGEAYTRDGRFRKDENGTLLTQDGFPVAWDGPRGTIDPSGEPLSVDGEGRLWQDGSEVGALKIAHFADPNLLRPDPYGNWRPPAGAIEAPHEAKGKQGYLESTNVSAIEEMVSMIAIQRRFEASTRAMSLIEQSYRRLIQPR